MRNVFPVPSAGIHPGVVPKALQDYGQDVILNAGTGIMDHPQGASAGVDAFFYSMDLNVEWLDALSQRKKSRTV